MNKNTPASNFNKKNTEPYYNNTTTTTHTTGYSGSNVVGLILLVIIVLIIIVAIYWAYQIYTNKTIQSSMSVEALSYIKDATSNFTVGSGTIPNSKYSNEYSISMWINIRDYSYNYGKEKCILRRGTGNSSNLELVLGNTSNDIIARVKLQTHSSHNNSLIIEKFDNIEPMTLQNFSYIGNNKINDTNNTELITPITDKIYKTVNNNFSKTSSEEEYIPQLKLGSTLTPILNESQTINNDFYSIISGNKITQNIIPQSYSNFADINISTTQQPQTTPQITQLGPTLDIPQTTQLGAPTLDIPSLITPPLSTIQPTNVTNDQNNIDCLVDETIGTCIYKMIPLQKWVHVIISVYNQVVDIYIDGVLASSCVLNGFPAISTDDVNITPDGGFSGQISRVTFFNTAMTVSNAQNLYYAGPVPTTNILEMIPTSIWYIIIILIIIAILYSLYM